MEGIKHKTLKVNGITMHVAEQGEGPVVLLLHGFPEFWYSWRHQMAALAASGYRAVAPDLRGYGDTEAPGDVSSYSCHHLVGDLVGLLRSLEIEEKVFLVAHDWGALVGWYFCLFRPDLIRAFVPIAVPFRPRNPTVKPVEGLRAFFGDDYYICRFQVAGEIEGVVAELGARRVLLRILTNRNPGPPLLPKEKPFGSSSDYIAPALPSWLSEDDLSIYADKFDQKGFTGGLNYYRALDLNWDLTAAWDGAQVKVPVKFIVGDMDMTYTTPGVKEYIHGGSFKKDVPLLEVVVVEGAGHFIQQERAEEITTHILDFIKHVSS